LEDGIKLWLRRTGYGSLDWIKLAQDRFQLVGCCEHGILLAFGLCSCGIFLDHLNNNQALE
jgi:hypothetical protein